MDVTHASSFGKLSFVHVTVDTFSGIILATARMGEAFKDGQQHLFACFAFLGMPLHLKTDNGPANQSKAFANVWIQFNIKHSTGIPYNSQGQAVIERSHQL